MLPHKKIFSTNFYIFAVTTTIIIISSSLNSNKILVNSYQLNSQNQIRAEHLTTIRTPSSKQYENTKKHQHNHHPLRLENNNKYYTQKLQHQQFHQQQQEKSQRHHHLLNSNRRHIPAPSTTSTSLEHQQPHQNKEHTILLNFEENEYPYNPLLSTLSTSTSNNHHKVLDEAKHPFSLTIPTHNSATNQKNIKSQQQNTNRNLKNPQLHHHLNLQHHSNTAINLRKKLYSSPTTIITTKLIKLQNESSQHRSLDHNHHHHHHHDHRNHHHSNSMTATNNQTTNTKDLNERKLHHGTYSPQSEDIGIAPTPINETETLALTIKNSLHQNKIILQPSSSSSSSASSSSSSSSHHKYYWNEPANVSKSKFHHKTITATETIIPKQFSESTGNNHQHYHRHYPQNHHQLKSVNKNLDKVHKSRNKFNFNNGDNIDDSLDNDDEHDDENDDSNDDDYYYYNEDQNYDEEEDEDDSNDNDDRDSNIDLDNDNDDNKLKYKVKGGDDKTKNNSHTADKGITLNRAIHTTRNTDELNTFDIDLIKKDLLINHEVLSNFERDFDLYDYIDDEPKDVNGTSSEKTSDSLTEEKWEKYGTAKAVANTRRRYYSQVQNVNAHIMRVGYEAECKIPKPKVIQISEPSKRYVPHCTVLHRCSDDTGCCQSDFRTCVMKKYQIVDLYFYVVPLGMKEPIVEILSFENHTECHCIERERYRPSSLQNEKNETANLLNDEPTKLNLTFSNSLPCQCLKHFTMFEEDNHDDADNDYHDTSYNSKKKCRCDCVSNDNVCQRLKQGEEGFDVENRKCVSENRCTIPTCEFGDYSLQNGRCPKNKQKRYIRAWHFD